MKTIISISLVVIATSSFSVWADIKNPVEKASSSAAVDKAAQKDSAPPASLANTPVPRGKLLYENHCTTCHDSTAHIRSDHKAKSIDDITYWVNRWQTELALKWKADEIQDVVNYLNDEYYKLKAPVRD